MLSSELHNIHCWCLSFYLTGGEAGAQLSKCWVTWGLRPAVYLGGYRPLGTYVGCWWSQCYRMHSHPCVHIHTHTHTKTHMHIIHTYTQYTHTHTHIHTRGCNPRLFKSIYPNWVLHYTVFHHSTFVLFPEGRRMSQAYAWSLRHSSQAAQ